MDRAERIESDLEEFSDDLSTTKARKTAEAIEELSREADNIGREDIKSEIKRLVELNVPVKEAKKSVKRLNIDSDDALIIESNSSSSDYEPNNSDSDYKLQNRKEYPENWDTLRRQAYKRDNYHCRNCGVGGGPHGDVELHAHHVVPVSAGGNHTLSNLYTLCNTCHNLIHTNLD
jgi:5-methylcytosine-specific restriction endonuclease McrA